MAYDHTCGCIKVTEEQYVKAIELLEKFNKESIYNIEVKPVVAVRHIIEITYYF
ncbi:hypothetical protein [Bacillus mycoides]|uniref:hypothetical protein n=1 Tax=Bacillus mycoides TaxID=1405 RepID=UPI003D647960